MLAVGLVALLLTYPYATLTWVSLLYLAMIPLAWRVFARKLRETEPEALPAAPRQSRRLRPRRSRARTRSRPRRRRRAPRNGRVLEMRATDPKR